MSVVTNIVAVLAITTTQTVPCPCPDGIEWCCTLHTKEVAKTRYEPIRLDDHDVDNPCYTRGVAISTEALAEALSFAYRHGKLPQLIPIRPLKGREVYYGGHYIGFLIGDAVMKECGLDSGDLVRHGDVPNEAVNRDAGEIYNRCSKAKVENQKGGAK